MIKTLQKDLILSSGRIVKKGTKITNERNSELLQVTNAKFDELDLAGYFKQIKKVNINNQNSI